MKTIYKYPVEIKDEQTIELPKGAQILSFQTQKAEAFIWALVDPEAPKSTRIFRLFGTGHEVDPSEPLTFIGTAQQLVFVWHLFEKTKG